MANPQIIPPTPTINQGQNVQEAANARVQNIFDRVAPEIKKTPTQQSPQRPPAQSAPPPSAAPTTENKTAAEPPQPPATTEAPRTEPAPPLEQERKLPSFIEEAFKVDAGQPREAEKEELPLEVEWKTPEENRKRWKGFRENYEALRKENAALKARPSVDEGASARLEALDRENKEMRQVLNRYTIEGNQDFQQRVIAPMTQAWNDAMKIVHESGGDASALSKAMALSGKSQYEAIDEVFKEMPYSAQTEAHAALSAYRRFDEHRRRALANAPQTVEALRKQDLARHHEQLQAQRTQMGKLYDNAVALLRDKAKVELLQRSDEPEAKWWNDQMETIVEGGRKLFLDNQDMDKVALACLMAPMVDPYRNMFLQERKKRMEAEKTLQERFGTEPVIGEGSGGAPPVEMDLNEPFEKAFLRKYHQLRSGVK